MLSGKTLLAVAVFSGAALIAVPNSFEASPPMAEGLEVRYLGNEGFLLAAGETRVLIDAVFGDGLAGYPVVPVELRRAIEAGRSPFDGVDFLLATHDHGDHFDPAAVRRFLTANPSAVFVSTPQAVERLMAEDESLGDRTRAVLPSVERPETVRAAGAVVRVFSLHHGLDRPVQNLGFLVEMGGMKILHVGDTEVDATEIGRLHLSDAGVDLALLPPWILAQEDLVHEGISPRLLGLMHVPARDAPSSYFGGPGSARGLIELLRSLHKDLIVFPEPGATVTIAGEGNAGR